MALHMRRLALPCLLALLPCLLALRHVPPVLAAAAATSSPSRCYYYSVRHTYEQELMDELALAGVDSTTVCPGLVRCAESFPELDPTYALQVLPQAEEVSAESTAALVRECLAALQLDTQGSERASGLQANSSFCRPHPPESPRAAA